MRSTSRGATRDAAPLRVLFVCTANISRSPYAERRARQLAGGAVASPLSFASAGVPGLAGQGMDPEMAAQLRDRGGDHLGHASRVVTHGVLAESDVVITVEFAQRLRIAERWPDQVPKIFGLNQLADALAKVTAPAGGLEALDAALAVACPDSLAFDVADPYRRGAAVARACADQIDKALAVIVPGLTGIPAGQEGGRHREDSATQLGAQAPRW